MGYRGDRIVVEIGPDGTLNHHVKVTHKMVHVGCHSVTREAFERIAEAAKLYWSNEENGITVK